MLRVLERVLNGPTLYRRDGIEVRERNGIRTLHLGSDTIQSAMRVDQPDTLELSYTRAMMAFLLFCSPPRRVLLVGLGGGSLAKHIFRTMPEASIDVVEVNEGVVDVARTYFHLPAACPRLTLSIGDGADYVFSLEAQVDALLVDAYDGRSLAASLATDHFFAGARRALGPVGVLAMNLWSNDRAFDRNVQRIERAFYGRCLCLPAERPGNVIVLAFANELEPARLRWATLHERAGELRERFGLEFPTFVRNLRQMNQHDAVGLKWFAESE
ncbi:MAG: spermidine synthase [Betaproteobacteria bacterium]|nr:MAG: spermidine synthase [Betaproteobacteria bacterium]